MKERVSTGVIALAMGLNLSILAENSSTEEISEQRHDVHQSQRENYGSLFLPEGSSFW